MRTRILWLPLLAALLAPALAHAADLTRIDRTIRKEPAYKGKPRYCLLAFGPEAKTHVWLVQDGDVLYVDRNGNGDLTDAGERVALKNSSKDFRSFEAGDVRDGALTHTGLVVTQMRATEDYAGNAKEYARIKGRGAEAWIWTVRVSAERPADDTRKLPKKISYVVNGDGLGFLVFAERPQDAPVIHFNGPWTLGLQDIKQRLVAGRKSMLQIGVGTQGVGPGTFSFVLYPDTIPATAYPVAEITFPAKSPDAKPITQRFTLTERC
jgi:hypothetical protein